MLEPVTRNDHERLGRYELLEEIGRGAMGVVYLAQDPLIGRQVALKVFRVSFSASDEEMRNLHARFIREAQSAGILSHPNIVTVHDVAPSDGETPAFIAMEHVEGRTLKQILDSPESLPRHRAIPLVTQVTEALEYAHSMGVVHRDIKPGNILITADDRVKITDFGIALVNSPNTTNHGQLLGTPNYMSPEAIEDEAVDHRADLFSLGVVLYELLTRHKPFAGKNMTRVTHRIVYEPFTPATEYVRDLPRALLSVIERSLEKKPERRFQSAAEMRTALTRAVDESTAPIRTAEIAALPAPVSPADTQSVNFELPQPRPQGILRRLGLRLTRATPVANVPLWLLVGGIIVGVGAGYFLSRTDSMQSAVDPVPAPSETVDRVDLFAERVRELDSAARVHLEALDLESAHVALLEAVRLRPASSLLVRRLAQVESELASRRAAAVTEVREQLDAARRSLANGRIRDAIQFANLALALDPMSLEAPDLIARAEAARQEIETRRRATQRQQPVVKPQPQESRSEPEAAAPAPAAAEAAPSPVPGTGTLLLRLETARSPGVLTVYAGGRQIFRDKFRFVEKRGFLRSLAAKPGAGELEESVELPAGEVDLRVYVSVRGGASQAFQLGGHLDGGQQRTLLVTIDEGGTARSALQ